MTGQTEKEVLQRYLTVAHEALLWKVEGVSEYDLRRPVVPTGTNLLGLVKHIASVESEYFGFVFGRPFPEELPWIDGEDNADMWATPDESSEYIIGLYKRVWAHVDATLEALPLETEGDVPWWSPSTTTLHRVTVHMIAEFNRHLGHADILRELIDGEVGLRKDVKNLPGGDEAWWSGYRDRLQQAADSFRP